MVRSTTNSQRRSRDTAPTSVLIGLLACLAVAGLLSSSRLLSIAERKEFSDSQERWVSAAELLDGAASDAYLNRPADELNDWLYPASSDDIVVGDLASGLATSEESSVDPQRRSGSAPQPTTTSVPSATTSSPSSAAETGPPTTSPSTTVPPTTIATTSTTPVTTTAPLRAVSEQQPLRIWSGGDSLGEYVGSQLLYQVVVPSLATVSLDYHISTGITRPDYFDWPATLSSVMTPPASEDAELSDGAELPEESAPFLRPEALVYMVGGNDNQPMRVGEEKLATNSPEWLQEYRRRVGLLMDIAAYDDVRLYWIGLPPMQDERRESIAVNVNDIIRAEADIRPWVRYINITPMLLNDEGVYDQYLVGPDGERRKAREGDGVHVTLPASRWISDLIWNQILIDWSIDLTVAPVETE